MLIQKTLFFLIAGVAFNFFASALPVPRSNDADIQNAEDQLEDLFGEDFGSNFIDTPKIEQAINDLENDSDDDYYYKRTPQDVSPISFEDLITPSLGGVFDSFVVTDGADQPVSGDTASVLAPDVSSVPGTSVSPPKLNHGKTHKNTVPQAEETEEL